MTSASLALWWDKWWCCRYLPRILQQTEPNCSTDNKLLEVCLLWVPFSLPHFPVLLHPWVTPYMKYLHSNSYLRSALRRSGSESLQWLWLNTWEKSIKRRNYLTSVFRGFGPQLFVSVVLEQWWCRMSCWPACDGISCLSHRNYKAKREEGVENKISLPRAHPQWPNFSI